MKELKTLKTISLFGTGFFGVAIAGSIVRLSPTILPISLVLLGMGLIILLILWLKEGFSCNLTNIRLFLLIGLAVTIAGVISSWL